MVLKIEIQDNALNLHSIITYAKQNNMPLALISMDNEKAFDRVEHNFIKKVIIKFNFPPTSEWFNILYDNTESKHLINGTFTENVDIKKGVMQGSALSMHLYILSLEPLIYKISNSPNIKGIHIPNLNKGIKTVQHADDTTYNNYNKYVFQTS